MAKHSCDTGFFRRPQACLQSLIYEQLDAELLDTFIQDFSEIRETLDPKKMPAKSPECPVLRYAFDRINEFLMCDGILALYDRHSDEAIPVPFNFKTNGVELGFIHGDGKRIQVWESDLRSLQLDRRIRSIEVAPPIGPENPTGRSFLLALALANLRLSDNFLPHPLRYLATGNVSNDKLGDVDSVEAKARLADGLKAKFLGPARPSLHHKYSFSAGEDLKGYLDRWSENNSFALPDNPTPDQCQKVRGLIEARMKVRSIANNKSLEILLRCKDVESEVGLEPMDAWRYDSLIGKCYNHLGHPEKAHSYLEMARKVIAEETPSCEEIDVVANLVVSLAWEQGDLEAASNLGENNLIRAKNLSARYSNAERSDSYMRASGSLGGQVLFQKAFF